MSYRNPSLIIVTFSARIGIVSQEPVLFNCSIADNIRMGRDGVTDLDIQGGYSVLSWDWRKISEISYPHFILKKVKVKVKKLLP